MGMLDNIQTGRENKPPRIMIYGNEGSGKTCTSAQAPFPIFIQTEDGLRWQEAGSGDGQG